MEVRSSNQLGLSARNLGEKNMSESNEKFESWGLLELFGHQRLACERIAAAQAQERLFA